MTLTTHVQISAITSAIPTFLSRFARRCPESSRAMCVYSVDLREFDLGVSLRACRVKYRGRSPRTSTAAGLRRHGRGQRTLGRVSAKGRVAMPLDEDGRTDGCVSPFRTHFLCAGRGGVEKRVTGAFDGACDCACDCACDGSVPSCSHHPAAAAASPLFIRRSASATILFRCRFLTCLSLYEHSICCVFCGKNNRRRA